MGACSVSIGFYGHSISRKLAWRGSWESGKTINVLEPVALLEAIASVH